MDKYNVYITPEGAKAVDAFLDLWCIAGHREPDGKVKQDVVYAYIQQAFANWDQEGGQEAPTVVIQSAYSKDGSEHCFTFDKSTIQISSLEPQIHYQY